MDYLRLRDSLYLINCPKQKDGTTRAILDLASPSFSFLISKEGGKVRGMFPDTPKKNGADPQRRTCMENCSPTLFGLFRA
jgi:hypothetical protein